MKHNVVEINGNRYRYFYDPLTGYTRYAGPVGRAPALEEKQFMSLFKDVVVTEIDDAWKKAPKEIRQRWVGIDDEYYKDNKWEELPLEVQFRLMDWFYNDRGGKIDLREEEMSKS